MSTKTRFLVLKHMDRYADLQKRYVKEPPEASYEGGE